MHTLSGSDPKERREQIRKYGLSYVNKERLRKCIVKVGCVRGVGTERRDTRKSDRLSRPIENG